MSARDVLLADGPNVAAALADALRVFDDLNGGMAETVERVARLADAALLVEAEPMARGILDGAVCQRTRAAVVSLTSARASVAGAVAALSALQDDLARLAEVNAA